MKKHIPTDVHRSRIGCSDKTSHMRNICANLCNLRVKKGLHISLFAFLLPFLSYAHESRPAYLEITQTTEESYDVTWKVPAKGPAQRLSLNLVFAEDVEYASLPTASYANAAYIERSSLKRPAGLAGTEIYIEGLSQTMTDALVRIQRLDGTTQTLRLSPEKPSFFFKDSPSSWDVSKTYTTLGIQHILGGIDHLLFVACLLLVAGRGRKLLITITGFTLAHSIPLALATLDIVRLPVPPVEAVIALSIVFLATEIARGNKQGLTYRYPIAVSVSFGLLHGFGFAAVLNQIGLPQSDVPVALLFFNVGVEIGQLLFIAALIFVFKSMIQPLKRLIKIPESSLITFGNSEILTAYAIGTVASYWMIERVAGFWT